ncbi:hypothetical protein HMPREF9960_0248 [Streptococcus cristatus ATCC 51100]|uniref:Uncharacterized protein n=1 Tax=Streptococcus cristatus ATCC 51100 TaxID=889201 RepID=A0AAV3ECX3_STRCR|nr:hypothetical protein HMPREF9960_0248 [Streptococcus cristatus ATCC 51100]
MFDFLSYKTDLIGEEYSIAIAESKNPVITEIKDTVSL